MSAIPGRASWLGSLLLGLGLWLLSAGAASAQPPEPLPEPSLRERLEALEKQNEQLGKILQEQREQLRQLEERARKEGAGKQADAPKADEAKKKEADEKTSVVGEDLKMSAAWRDGVWFETADRAFRFSVGGRVDFDSTWFSSSDALKNSIGLFNNYVDPGQALDDAADFRRARLRFQGTAWEVMEFLCEYEFASFLDLRRRNLGVTEPDEPTEFDFEPSATTRFNQVWLGFNHLPVVGTFRAGHQREWLTFASATSARFLTFMERPLLVDAFNIDFLFTDGFTVQRTFLDERVYAYAGFFRVNTLLAGFDAGDGDYAYDTRLTCVPIWDEPGRRWLHLGADYSYRTLHLDRTRFRARPPIHGGVGFQVPNIINTGTVFSRDGQQVATLEYASAWGPLTLTAEACASWVIDAFTGGLPLPDGSLPDGARSRGTYFAHGYYVEALYFLTGEHRGYRREQPGYDRIRPAEPFFLVRGEDDGCLWGRGAWEVGVRYDFVDLTDAGINGGSAHAVTLGLNWHLNPNMKVQWNYVWMDRHFTPPDNKGRQDGSFTSLGMRFHWDF